MTLFAFREAKSHEWTFCDPIMFEVKLGVQNTELEGWFHCMLVMPPMITSCNYFNYLINM